VKVSRFGNRSGGQQVGSIFGHGSYVAPDWTADWLHRETTFILSEFAREFGFASFESMTASEQIPLKVRLKNLILTNTYDPATGRTSVPAVRARAFEYLVAYYQDVFSQGREEFAIPRGALTDAAKIREMCAFFWWTSWASSTERPGQHVSYTQNWPHEPLAGNEPTADAVW